ncbi:MAG: metallophosphoesterase [Clostridia bacterium]|nr:metallophosphoesterase [Clostridia bacterium]
MRFASKLGKTEVTRKGNFEAYETTLYLAGVTKPLTLLLGSDTHMCLTDYRDDLARKNFTWQRRVWFPFGQDILEDIVTFPSQNKVDFTVFLGDVIDFPSQKNMETLTELLSRQTLGDYLYIEGNHDYNFPEEDINGTPEALRAIDALAVRANGYTELTPKEYQGGFHAVDLGEVIIAGGNNITKEGREAMIKGVKDLYGSEKPVILCFHRPIESEGIIPSVMQAWKKNGLIPFEKDEVASAATAENSPVAALFSGDVHFFHTNVVNGCLPQIVVSSQEKKIKTGTPAESDKYWSGIGIVHILPLEK